MIQSIDDFLQKDSLIKLWESDKQDREEAFDRSKPSLANYHLKDLKATMKINK